MQKFIKLFMLIPIVFLLVAGLNNKNAFSGGGDGDSSGGGDLTGFAVSGGGEAAEIAANGYEYNIDPAQTDKDNDRYRLTNHKVRVSKFRDLPDAEKPIPCVSITALTSRDLFIPLKTRDEFAKFLHWARETPEGQANVSVTWCKSTPTSPGGGFNPSDGCNGGYC